MSSLLCVKQPGGSVQVHKSDAVEELMIDSQDHISFSTTLVSKAHVNKRRAVQRPMSTPNPMARKSPSMDSQSLIGQTLRVQDWLNEKTLKSLQEKSVVETRAARQLYSPLLETESTFVKQDVDEFLSYKSVLDTRKKEMLHKKWNDRVYEPLRREIIQVMDSYNWPEVDRRKRELHKQYLEFVNQKGHVFLDTVDPGEYYAQALNGHRPAPIKVVTPQFADPLLSQGRQKNAEERTILRCLTGNRYTDKDVDQVKLPPMPLVPLGRHGTDSIQWLEMPLNNIESSHRMASRRRMRGVYNTGHVDFEAWSRAPYDAAVVDKELQIQKKRMFAEKPPYRKARLEPVKPADLAPMSPQGIAPEIPKSIVQETIAVQAVDMSTAPPQNILRLNV